MSDETTQAIQYYTRTFTILYDALVTTPKNFPWAGVLEKIRGQLKKGWHCLEKIQNKSKHITKAPTDFVQKLSKRTKVSEEKALELLDDFINSEVPEDFKYNDEGVERVYRFYGLERIRVIDCITALLRIELSNIQDPDILNPVKETIEYLIKNNLEENAINWFREATTIKTDDTSMTSFEISQYIDQKLNEQGAILDLLFMLYYNTVHISSENFFKLLRLFIELDCGNSQRNLSFVSPKGQLAISRVVNLSILIIMETLNLENIEMEPTLNINEIHSADDIISSVLGTDAHHGALFLGWAAFLRMQEDYEENENIKKYVEKGLKYKGLEFYKKMLDKENSESFPFHGYTLNIEGYRSVVKGVIAGILGLFNVDKIPFKLIQEILDVTSIVLEPMVKDSSLASQFYHEDLRTYPYFGLFTFLRSLFPLRTELLQLLTCAICDEKSAKEIYEVIERQDTYCVEIPVNVFERFVQDYDGTLLFVQPFRDAHGFEIPVHSQVKQYTKYGEAYYVTVIPRLDFPMSGWRILFRIGDKETMHRLLMIIYKILKYSPDHKQEFDKKVEGGLINFIIRLPVYPAICKCFTSLSMVAPSQVAQVLHKFIPHFHQYLKFECSKGRFDACISFLESVLLLTKHHLDKNIDQVYKLIPYICSNIFAVHDSWRYQRLEQRWMIAEKCLTILNQISKDSFWKKSKIDTSLGVKVLNAFLRDSSLYQILFQLIGLGSTFLETTLKYEKTEEAIIINEMIAKSLKFLECLLQYRISLEEKIITPFEDLLLSYLIGKKQVPLIATIFEFMDDDYSVTVRVTATRVITLIAKLTEQYHPRPPSLVGYLGSRDKVLVGRCLYRLRKYGESSEWRNAFFELVSTCVENQRGLSELFLYSSPIHTQNTNEIIPTHGCIETILDLLQDPQEETYYALLVLQSVFASGEHAKISEHLKNDSKFWDSLFNICERNERSASICIYIMALKLYVNSDNLDLERMKSLVSPLLDKSIKFIITEIKKCEPDVLLMNQKSRQLNIQLTDFLTEKVDKLYSTRKLRRWVGDEELVNCAKRLNERLLSIESHLSIMESLHALLQVWKKKDEKFLAELLNILLIGLNISTEQHDDEYYIKIPLPLLLDSLATTLHRHTTSMLLSIIQPLPKIERENITKMIHALDAQVQRRKENMCNEMLICLIMCFTKSKIVLDDVFLITPIISNCMKIFKRTSSCCISCLNILSLISRVHYTEEIGNFIIQLVDFSSNQNDYLLNVLNALVSLSFTQQGCNNIVMSRVLQKITNHIEIDFAIYENGEKTKSHQIWCLLLKLVCTLLNTSKKVSASILHLQVDDFCAAFKNRILHSLVKSWDSLNCGILEEAHLASMLTYSLGRRGIIPSFIINAALYALEKCAHHVCDARLLRETAGVTPKERKLRELYLKKENLEWVTMVYTPLYRSFQALLGTIRTMTVLPSLDGYEEERSILRWETTNVLGSCLSNMASTLKYLVEIKNSKLDEIILSCINETLYITVSNLMMHAQQMKRTKLLKELERIPSSIDRCLNTLQKLPIEKKEFLDTIDFIQKIKKLNLY